MSRILSTARLIGAFSIAAVPAGAVDGVVEINQARALAGGVTIADTPGFPVTLVSGSYRLTGNLSWSTGGGIEASAPNVSLDLNGFEIAGPNTCSGTPPAQGVACSVSNFTEYGIATGGASNLYVHHGTVRGSPYINIECNACRVESVHVREGLVGISTQGGSVISGCTAERNGNTGISSNTGTTGAVVVGNTARWNGGSGFFFGGGTVGRDNVAVANFEVGIFSNGGTIADSTSTGNGSHGLRMNNGTVIGNHSSQNVGYGLLLVGLAGYGSNAFTLNTAGSVSGTGMQLSPNLCHTVPCP